MYIIDREIRDDVEYAGFGERLMAALIDLLIIVVPSIFVPIVLPWLYYAFQESSEDGATVGKNAMGIRVVTIEGHRLSFGQATGRFFCRLLNIFTFGIGYLMMLVSSKRQCLHDVLAGTAVIRVKAQRVDAPKRRENEQSKSWTAKVNADEMHYIRITENGGQYIYRTAAGDHKTEFALWQLADGKVDFTEEFGAATFAEMQRFSEALMYRLA
jgi:uncharacterized RDD family membrane protein YckC